MAFKKWIGLFAIVFMTGISTPVVGARAASPQDESRGRTEQNAGNRDYTNNKNYQLGERDGQTDYKHNRDHSKKRHFKTDEDQKAYEEGYQHGRQGTEQVDTGREGK